VIEAKNLTKIYRRKKKELKAIDKLSFNVRKGEIFGIIGPTGAGKTTTVKILSTLILPDEGNAYINGYDVVKDADRVKKIIGVVAGEFTRALYWRLTGRGNLEFFAKMRGLRNINERIDYLLELFNLKDYENELLMRYSTGMKHKLALAVALLHDPPILFLDEPLTGIDPLTAYEIKELIRREFKDKTIIWTSHNLYEIEEMCHRILLLNKGKKIVEGKVNELKKKYWEYKKIIVDCENPEKLAGIAEKIEGNMVEIKTKNVEEIIKKLAEMMENEDIKINSIKTVEPSLEDIFMAVVKNDKRN